MGKSLRIKFNKDITCRNTWVFIEVDVVLVSSNDNN